MKPYSVLNRVDVKMVIQSQEEIIEVFDGFRKELDESNDRRERIIKVHLVYDASGGCSMT